MSRAGQRYVEEDRGPEPPTRALDATKLTPRRRSRSIFEAIFPLLLGGYLLFDRSFAWLHIPGTPIFIGEIALVAGLPFAVRALRSRALWKASSAFALLVAFVVWGLIRSVPGLISEPIDALRDSVLWAYGLISLAVLGVLMKRAGLVQVWLERYRSISPWAIVWLPLTVIVSVPLLVPDSTVPLVSYKPGNAAVHIFMATAFLWTLRTPTSARGERVRIALTAIAVLGTLVLATQGRGGFVAVLVGSAVLLFVYEERTKLIVATGVSLIVASLLILAVDPDLRIGDRELSVEQLTANVQSIVEREGEGALGANIQWRLEHWGNIWLGVNHAVPFGGHGFGTNLALEYDIPQADLGLRNAHNSHLTVFARMGWIGLVIWFAMWGFWFSELTRTRRRARSRGDRFAQVLTGWLMAAATAIQVNAIFDPTIEGPQVGFWLWAVFALGLFLGMDQIRWRTVGTQGSVA